MDKIKEIIEVLYDEHAPLVKFFGFKPDFKVQKDVLCTILFPTQPASPEESAKMMDNSQLYVEMMLAAEILAVEKSESEIPTIMAGKKFEEFVKEAKAYVDQDAIIIRTLGISRQDFDYVVNEYKEIAKTADSMDAVLENWEDLDHAVKTGILRGIMFQRSILAMTLQHFEDRAQKAIKYQVETMQILDSAIKGEEWTT